MDRGCPDPRNRVRPTNMRMIYTLYMRINQTHRTNIIGLTLEIQTNRPHWPFGHCWSETKTKQASRRARRTIAIRSSRVRLIYFRLLEDQIFRNRNSCPFFRSYGRAWLLASESTTFRLRNRRIYCNRRKTNRPFF